MTVIYERQSQNGRRGVQVTAEADTRFPARGQLQDLGTLAGVHCFSFTPTDEDEWVVVGDDLEPLEGCVSVYHDDMQGGDVASLLVARPGAVWRQWGYKRRGSDFCVLSADGSVQEPPVSVLLAAGLVKPDKAPALVPEAPVLPTAMQLALEKAGIIAAAKKEGS